MRNSVKITNTETGNKLSQLVKREAPNIYPIWKNSFIYKDCGENKLSKNFIIVSFEVENYLVMLTKKKRNILNNIIYYFFENEIYGVLYAVEKKETLYIS